MMLFFGAMHNITPPMGYGSGRMWEVRTGTIDITNVHADSAMEAATIVFEHLKEEAKVTEENRLFNIGMITECKDKRDPKAFRKFPHNHTYYVLTSTVLANAGLYDLCRELQKIEKDIKGPG